MRTAALYRLARYTDGVSVDEKELAYYRAVEDHFAALRGVPHLLSPADFQLLRTWWRRGVPLGAVLAGIGEVFARRAERGETDPVVSLAYCRHAVERHAARLAEARVGSGEPETGGWSQAEELERLVARCRAAAEAQAGRPTLAHALARAAAHLEALAAHDDPDAAEEALMALEAAVLAAAWGSLSEAERESVEGEAAARAARSGATGEALERSRRALRDRVLRERLGLPRLELG